MSSRQPARRGQAKKVWVRCRERVAATEVVMCGSAVGCLKMGDDGKELYVNSSDVR